MDDIDWEMLRRFAGFMQGGLTLEQAKAAGFVQDANDEMHWDMAAEDPEFYTKDSPDTEIVNIAITDMKVVDEMLARIKGM